MKKFLLPGVTTGVAATVAATALAPGTGSSQVPGSICPPGSKVRPSDLPVYEDHKDFKTEPRPIDDSAVEQTIGQVRKELWVFFDQYQGYKQKVVEVLEIGKAHTEATLEFLKEEKNVLPRAGAIGLGGLAGIVFGLRGGFVRKLLYGSTGSIAMASLCYPRQAAEVSQDAILSAKKYAVIGYNFVYGVKPEAVEPQTVPEKLDVRKLFRADQANKNNETKSAGSSRQLSKKEDIRKESGQGDFGQSNPADKDLYTTRS